jgi:hypothetical protein
MLTIRRAAALDELAVEAPPQLFNGCRLELNPRCHRRHGWRAYRHNRRCQELWFHPCSRASWTGVEDDDPVALGSDQLFGAELPKHTHNNLTNRTDNVASSRWLTRTCSSSRADMPCDAKSSRCRATRWGTVVNAPPEISATKPCTRSLSSGSKAARDSYDHRRLPTRHRRQHSYELRLNKRLGASRDDKRSGEEWKHANEPPRAAVSVSVRPPVR